MKNFINKLFELNFKISQESDSFSLHYCDFINMHLSIHILNIFPLLDSKDLKLSQFNQNIMK